MEKLINKKYHSLYLRRKKMKIIDILFYQNSLYLLLFHILFFYSLNKDSEIILLLNKGDNQAILNNLFPYDPSEILVNGYPGNCYNKICNLTEETNYVTIRFNTNIETCANMFKDLTSIKEIDLSNFDASQVTNMESMFNNCKNLKKIVFGNIITSSVDNMAFLFSECKKLTSIDLSSFDTSSVTNFNLIFSHCEKLKSLDLSNFNTSKATSMEDFFGNCDNLEIIKFQNFDTSKVRVLKGLFYNCKKLKYLDLANLNTDSADTFWYMFSNCQSLVYLNLHSLKINDGINLQESSFEGINPNFKLCINDQNTENLLLGGVISDCTDFCFNENRKFDLENNQCVESCEEYKYESDNLCFQECPDNLFKVFKEQKTICLDYVPENFYYNSNDKIYKECYQNCKQCSKEGDETLNNCDLCKNDFLFLDDPFATESNCYEECEFFYYFDIDNNNKYTCTESNTCPINYKHINDKKKCIDECKNDNIYILEFNNSCYEECPNGTYRINETFLCEKIEYLIETTNLIKNEEIDTNNIIYTNDSKIQIKLSISSDSKVTFECSFDSSLNNDCNFVDIDNNTEIYDILKENIMDIYKLDNGKSQVITTDNKIYQVTDEKNELELLKNGSLKNHHLSIIDLGECEKELRTRNNISDDETLVYLKQESISNKSSEKDIKYEVFKSSNNEKLNLSVCDEIPINIYVSLQLSEETNEIYQKIKDMGFNMFDIDDPFYKDRCTSYKTSNNTDMLLSDRINYIYYNDDSECQPGCEFTSYISNTQFLNCTCNAKESTNVIKNEITNENFFQIFYDVLKYSNFKILKCYKLIFAKNALYKNYGSIFIIICFLLYLITLFIHIFKGTNLLKKILNVSSEKKAKPKIMNNNKIFCNIQINNNASSSKKNLIRNKKEKLKNPPNKKSSKNILKKKKTLKKVNNENESKSKIQKSVTISKFKKSYLMNNSSEKINKNKLLSKVKIKTSKKIKLDPFELNELKYEEAKRLDKRTFMKIYSDYLNRESLILFTFFICNDYNLIYIKLARFLFLVITDMSLNVFFFSDDSMHKVFLNYGKYNFVQQIPKIIYSFFVTQLIELFLCFLSLTDKYYYQIKKIQSTNKVKNLGKIIKCIKIKLFFFYLFTFIFFGFYWYITAAFCAVYENTQLVFIKDSISSFALGLAYPIVLYLITSGLRVFAIRNKKMNLKCVYKLSDIIPFF